jgi:23S rRNA pseudouridine2604 synthase
VGWSPSTGRRSATQGRKIARGQTLTLADDAQAELSGALTMMIHKPVGVVSAHPDRGQPEAAGLLTADRLWGQSGEAPGLGRSLPPLGRLDMDSRGLLLLSEDGVAAKAVIGPESQLDKEYLVTVEGAVTGRKLSLLRYGLRLDGRQLKRAQVGVDPDGRLRFVLTEGRNRQIRRMCEMVELRVVDLFRIRVGPLTLGDLPEGRWRPLTPAERAALIAGGGAV